MRRADRARWKQAASLAVVTAVGVHRFINSDRFESALCWYDGATTRYYFATLALFQRNRAEYLGIDWDRPDWREADADQAKAARSVSRWQRRHIDSAVARQLGWDRRTGWAA